MTEVEKFLKIFWKSVDKLKVIWYNMYVIKTKGVKIMKYEQVINELNTRRKGTLISVSYKSEPTLTAQAKKSGIKVEKYTTTTARIGVTYANIKAVKMHRELDTEDGVVRPV